MTANRLTLNSAKTEFLFIGLKQKLGKIHNTSLNTETQQNQQNIKKLEVRGRARREAARRRKFEWKVNLGNRNSSRSNGS